MYNYAIVSLLIECINSKTDYYIYNPIIFYNLLNLKKNK